MKKLTVIIFTFIIAVTLNIDAMAQNAPALTPMRSVARPEIEMMNTLDPSAFAFAYWDGGTFTITPMPGRSAEIHRAVAEVRTAAHPNLPTIAVRPEPMPGTTYSFAQRTAARQFLVENRDALRIQGVGFNRNGLGVFMLPSATPADRQALLAAAPITAIEFLAAQAADPAPPVPPGGVVIDTSYTPLPPGSPPPVITGASLARREQRRDWSSFTVSAVRNWNGVTGEAGVLTIGHGFRSGQPVFAGSNSGRVGVADVRFGDNLDVTFVRLDNPSQFPRGYMRGGDRVSRMVDLSVFDYGRVVGNHTTIFGTTVGQIVLTQHSFRMWTEEGVFNFDNAVVINNPVRVGNSGSPVLTDRITLAGLVVAAAGTRSGANWSHSIVLPISDVVAATGFLPAF